MSGGRRPPPRDPLLVALCGALLFLPGLGSRDLWNPDEPRYAEVAREMLLTGDFLVPRFNGEIYTQKPPLQFWAMAASSLATGALDERAARLPAALAAIGTLVLTHALGRRLFGRAAAWIAVGALATGVKVLWQGRIGQIDMLLTFLVTLAVGCWLCGELEGRPAFQRLFFAAAGLATLAKGPAGLLPPLLAILALYALTRDRGGLARLRPVSGLGVWAAVTLAWVVPAGIGAGREYIEQIVLRQNLTRYADPWHHQQPWYYYLTTIPADFLPWSILLPGALVVGWRRLIASPAPSAPAAAGEAQRQSGWERIARLRPPRAAGPDRNPARAGDPAAWGFLFCLCWVAATVVFFSVSPAKRTVYVLTMFPGLALALGAGLDRLVGAWPRERRWLLAPLALLAALSAALAAAAGWSAWHLGHGTARGERLAARIPELAQLPASLPAEVAGWLGASALGAAAALLLAVRNRPRAGLGAVAAGTAACALGLVLTVLPEIDAVKSARPIAERFLAESAPGEPYAVFPRLDAPVVFYTRRFAHGPQSVEELRAFAERPRRVWAFVERDDLAKIDPPLPLREVARAADPRDGYVLLASPPAPAPPPD